MGNLITSFYRKGLDGLTQQSVDASIQKKGGILALRLVKNHVKLLYQRKLPGEKVDPVAMSDLPDETPIEV